MFDDNLIVDHANAAALADPNATDPTAFGLIRKNGIGASEAAVIVNVNPFTTLDKLIQDKISPTVSADQLAISQKENVRKGTDLEEIVLKHFQAKFAGTTEVLKPPAMYRSKAYPHLTVNYDGILFDTIPVECKFVSTYATKYWETSRAIDTLVLGRDDVTSPKGVPWEAFIEMKAKEAGIPIYYYMQLQHQMLLAGASFSYLTTVFDKGWEYRTFLVNRNLSICEHYIVESKKVWDKITKIKEARSTGPMSS